MGTRIKYGDTKLTIIHEPFEPKEGQIYTNYNGRQYQCLNVSGEEAVFINLQSGWTFTAHHCVMYEDGTIEWDYSTGGRFERGEPQ